MYDVSLKTDLIGKKVNYLTSCHSTNDLASDKVKDGTWEDGEIFITDEQKNGRGQRGTTWSTQSGMNLTFSVILAPNDIFIENQFVLSQMVALAVDDFFKAYLQSSKIKWPNDILVNNKKAVGISIENRLRGRKVNSSVIGIGVNINQLDFENPNATSLRIETGEEWSLKVLFEDLLVCLDIRYKQLQKGELKEIHEEYVSKLAGLNEKRLYKKGEVCFSAVITGVTAAGKLQMLTEDGLCEYDLKEISWNWS